MERFHLLLIVLDFHLNENTESCVSLGWKEGRTKYSNLERARDQTSVGDHVV